MATHSSILAQRISCTEAPRKLKSMGSQSYFMDFDFRILSKKSLSFTRLSLPPNPPNKPPPCSLDFWALTLSPFDLPPDPITLQSAVQFWFSGCVISHEEGSCWARLLLLSLPLPSVLPSTQNSGPKHPQYQVHLVWRKRFLACFKSCRQSPHAELSERKVSGFIVSVC